MNHSQADKHWYRYGIGVGAFALSYFLSGELGLFINSGYQGVTPLWPPSGIAAFVFLVYGQRYWPGIFIAIFALAWHQQVPPLAAFIAAAGNSLEALMVAYLLKRFDFPDTHYGTRSHVLLTGLGATLSPMVAGSVGALGMCMSGLSAWDGFFNIALTWWLGNGIGILVFTPLLLSWHQPPQEGSVHPAGWEYLLITLLVFAVSVSEYLLLSQSSAGLSLLPYLFLPLSLWAAFRLGMRGTTLVVALLTLMVMLTSLAVIPGSPGGNNLGTVLLTMALVAITAFTAQSVAANQADRNRDTRALQLSENRYRKLVETMNEGLGIQDNDGVFRYVNQRLCEMLGMSHDELIDKPAADILGDKAFQDWKKRTNARQTDSFVSYETRFKRPDGREAAFLISPQILEDEHGNFAGSFGVFTDLTERRYWDDRLRILSEAIEQNPNGISITDDQGMIEYVNPAFGRATGYRTHEVVGRPISLLNSGKHSAEFFRQLWSTVATGEIWRGEIINRKKDGSLFTNQLVAAPILSPEKTVNHYISIHTDITQLRDIEARAREHLDQLALLNRQGTLNELGAGLAHELNQPLTAVTAYAETLLAKLERDNFEPALFASMLEKTIAESHRAGRILRNVRGFISQQPSERTAEDLNAIIDATINLFRGELKKYNVELSLQLGSAPLPVMVNQTQMEQVLVNVLANARQAIDEHGVITVSTVANDGHAETLIADNGCGIDPEHRDHLFDPFYTTKHGGLGVGLAISRSIMETHDGTITLENTGPDGSTFKLSLPLIPD